MSKLLSNNFLLFLENVIRNLFFWLYIITYNKVPWTNDAKATGCQWKITWRIIHPSWALTFFAFYEIGWSLQWDQKCNVIVTYVFRTIIWENAFWARSLILVSFVGREKIFKDCAREGAEQLSALTSGNWGAAEKKTWDHKETKNLGKCEPQALMTPQQKMTSSSQAKLHLVDHHFNPELPHKMHEGLWLWINFLGIKCIQLIKLLYINQKQDPHLGLTTFYTCSYAYGSHKRAPLFFFPPITRNIWWG